MTLGHFKQAEMSPFQVVFIWMTINAALQQSMPDFRRRLEGRLRTPDEGADTVVWLCVSQGLTNGAFYLGKV